ncbi:glycosyltransferase involved in cell wall biosynthesis [Xanthomonas sacchari]|uniref:glycosyltransferase n=1 Tax=Xanthomonas sacchari TaxID=56458 RepID=UPI002781FA43|nr:glycosyltransferase [Xanthomonas sacchari]MDQ1092277.1 glycosyltransferase involved in cell wall biosynthesis [Xanthomonas sacchari]
MKSSYVPSEDAAPSGTGNTRRRLVVGGVALRGSGYPNAWNTLRILREAGMDIVDLCHWLPEDFHLWKLTRLPLWQAAIALSKLAILNITSAIKILLGTRRNDLVYIPYPGALLLWMLSWVPKRLRPPCLCDAYITIWDTLYQDRGLGGRAGGWLSNLVHRFESRALRCANGLIVDTNENADHIAATFGVERRRIHTLPLAMEEISKPSPSMTSARNAPRTTRIIFFGTFVPLQGTTKIAQTIALLRDRNDMEFILIGDGQAAHEAEPYLAQNPNVRWIREWLATEELMQQIEDSDICLGVFGGPGKSARVLPFKIYIALAAGKAIITQRDHGLPDSVPPIPAFFTSPIPEEIAAGLKTLAADVTLRSLLADAGPMYYRKYLGPSQIAMRWQYLMQSGAHTDL